MMAQKYACIKDGKVENIILADEEFIEGYRNSRAHEWDRLVRYDHLIEQPHIGWDYDWRTDKFTPSVTHNPKAYFQFSKLEASNDQKPRPDTDGLAPAMQDHMHNMQPKFQWQYWIPALALVLAWIFSLARYFTQ